MKIVLADDHGIVLRGLRALIEEEPDYQIVGQAENGRQAIDLVLETRADVAILDITMPELNGIEAARAIHTQSPHTQVIILSMHSEDSIVKEALEAGCRGYVLKSSLLDEVMNALAAVAKGNTYLSPRITDLVVNRYVDQMPGFVGSTPNRLTATEREVLQLVAEGQTTKQIAARLHRSSKAIDTARQRLMSKLDLHSVADLTKYAVRMGLTSLEV